MADVESTATQPRLGVIIGLSAAIGLAAGGGVIAFLSVEHQTHHLLWETLPDALGLVGAPGWWVYAVLGIGAVGVWAALKLPGHGGHRPLDGLGFDIGPREIISVVVAALISLSIGAVVGPEMPLMAVGSAIAAVLGSRIPQPYRQVLMLSGAAAALTLILGNPLVSGILILEVLALRGSPGGKQAMLTVLPVIVAMGSGYIIQTGAGDWSGVGESQLAVPGLPAYDRVMGIDLLMLIPVALITGLIGVIVVELGHRIQVRASARPLAVIVGAALVVATAAVGTRAITGESIDYVLFSGQQATASVIGITSVGTLMVIMAAKSIAYCVCVGSGFRGGLIFPAMFLGVVHATIATLIVDEANLTALAGAGIAAGVASLMRLPFTSVVLAVLLCGPAVTTPAIFGGVIGMLLRLGVDRRNAVEESDGVEASPAAQQSA